jgi:hypothetical protein
MCGMLKASIATKCIDQRPPPSAMAAAPSHKRCTLPFVDRARDAKPSAVNDARIAISSDSATR